MWTTSDSLSSPITALERARGREDREEQKEVEKGGEGKGKWDKRGRLGWVSQLDMDKPILWSKMFLSQSVCNLRHQRQLISIHQRINRGNKKEEGWQNISYSHKYLQRQTRVVLKLWVAATQFWKISIWHNVHEGMVFKSTNNALFRVPLCCLFIIGLAVHACGEDVLQPMSFLYSLEKKKHLGLTHTMTNRDKRAHINIHCLVPEQLRLLNDSDNKNSMSCLCYGERSNGSSGLRDMGIISFVLDCHRRDLRLTSGHWSLLTA